MISPDDKEIAIIKLNNSGNVAGAIGAAFAQNGRSDFSGDHFVRRLATTPLGRSDWHRKRFVARFANSIQIPEEIYEACKKVFGR